MSRDRWILRMEDPEAVAAIDALPWLGDGLEETEREEAQVLMRLGLASSQVLGAVVNKSWTQDGLNPDETSTIRFLTEAPHFPTSDRQVESEVLRLLDIPFLESVDGIDAAATRTLVRSQLNHEHLPLALVLSHPTLDDGITDDEASVLAVLEIVNQRQRSWLPEVLLDPERTSTARRVISLPLAGETTLAVVSVVGGEVGSLNMLEGVVRAEEEFMGVPFPNSFAVFLIADASRRAGGAVFYSGAITVDPTFQASWGIVAHEVAHMYWTHGATRWITEGAAELMETIS